MSPWGSQRLNPKLGLLCASAMAIVTRCAQAVSGVPPDAVNLEFVLTDCWAAIYERADATARHNHFPCDLAAVVYLEAEENCAPIVFGDGVAVQPRPRTMIVFPGLLDHEVPATVGRRIIIAMNFHKKATFAPAAP